MHLPPIDFGSVRVLTTIIIKSELGGPDDVTILDDILDELSTQLLALEYRVEIDSEVIK